MKKIFLMLLATIIVGCASTQYIPRTAAEMDEIAYILETYHPELYFYYVEGVLRIKSVSEIVLEDGTSDYIVDYDFVRYNCRTYEEKLAVLEEHYPELYRRYRNGTIVVRSIYKEVDRRTGRIEYNVSYRYNYGSYYEYPYVVIRRGIDPLFTPPPRPRVRPRPQPRPDAEPNNPPRPNDRPIVRPNEQPRRVQPSDRPNNPPTNNQPRVQPNNNQPRQSQPNNQPRVQRNNQPRTQPQSTPRSNGNTSTRSTQGNGGNRQGQGGGGRR